MAVFTQLTNEQIAQIVDNYDCGALLDASGIAEGSENTNYLCNTSDGKMVLTLFEARSNPAHIPTQIQFVQDLYQSGLPVPHILTTGNNEVLYDFSGKKAILQTFLEGKCAFAPTEEQCKAAGELLADMHKVGEKAKTGIKNALGYAELPKIAQEIQAKEDSEDLNTVIDFLQQYQPPGVPIGAVHADYFKDNVFFTDNTISGVFDFWFACDDMLVYDLAIALNVWGFDKGEHMPTLFDAFLAGYTAKRPLNATEKEALPQELKRASARFYLTRLYDKVLTDKNLANKPPETWYKRFQFHANEAIF
jgi:homoserine kinase type II